MRFPTAFLFRLSFCLQLVMSATAAPVAARDEAATDTTAAALITDETLIQTGHLIGLEFTPTERDTMLADVREQLGNYEALRELEIGNEVPPALGLDIDPAGCVTGESEQPVWSDPGDVARPDDLAELAFWAVSRLAALVESRQVTSVELTRLCLDRLERFGPQLECVITLLPDRALAAAAKADAEIAAGRYRGPLHGIPYGAKDLFAVAGAPTTWGAMPYRDQVIDDDAVVIKQLDAAGAVLVAKLTLGALAWGDVWFGGTTKNPWNLEQGSSGSSAGSASSVSAGLVPFALGTETWGSIVSPCTRCGVTGLRPTHGAVSRTGAMALSWSMDKVGPICREVEDCALVFDVLRRPARLVDPADTDQIVRGEGLAYRPDIDLSTLRIGYLEADFAEDYPGHAADSTSLAVLRGLGAELIPITLPDLPIYDMSFILSAEAAAAFDELTLSGRDDELVRQIRYAWPNVFRSARTIPAVEYIQANRARTLLIREMVTLMETIDVYMAPSFSSNLLLTNLTGHPCVVVPNGLSAVVNTSFSFTGQLGGDGVLLSVANTYQQAAGFLGVKPEGY